MNKAEAGGEFRKKYHTVVLVKNAVNIVFLFAEVGRQGKIGLIAYVACV